MNPNLRLIDGGDDGHPDLLEIRRISYRPDLDVLLVAGELDARTAPALSRELSGHNPDVLICDLTGVRFLGITGLTVVLRAAAAANARGRRFGVVATARAVLRLVQCSGAVGLEVFASLADAVRELPGGSGTARPDNSK